MVSEGLGGMSDARRCEFCAKPLVGRDPRARFCDDKCRAKGWKARTGYGVVERRVRTVARRTSRRAPDLRISYRRAVDAMCHYPGAERKLRALLTDKQRAHLDGTADA
jgi:ribosomal protein L15E